MDPLTILLAAMVGIGLLGAALALTLGGTMDLQSRLAGFDSGTNEEAPSVREAELRASLYDRIFVPAFNKVGSAMSRRLGSTKINAIERQLQIAGFNKHLTASGFLAIRVIAGIIGLGLGILLVSVLSLTPPISLLGIGGFAFGGFTIPQSKVDGALRKRRKEILRAMPAALDLLTICVQGGLSFDSAMQEVASKYENALSAELTLMLNEIRLGRTRRDAMRAMGERIGIDEVTNFIDAILQSEQLGSPLADALTIQSEEMRRRRRQRAEELGQKAPIKMLLPLVGCVFPTIFVILLGPAALVILRQVMGVPQ